ncbi:hypothetical protein JOM56_008125 [Amanita muscaria]
MPDEYLSDLVDGRVLAGLRLTLLAYHFILDKTSAFPLASQCRRLCNHAKVGGIYLIVVNNSIFFVIQNNPGAY